jgi:alkanesulfonate monooxygenase SsuD/methylene tetrahydromethanopterin reductase-like flavin-dependent oxidoreductase (luciferase family)
LSGGRVELGLTRSTAPEWRLFNIDPDDVRAQTQQAFEIVPKIWTSERFSYHSDTYQIDDVAIGPKPLQRPHRPLWQDAASPGSFEDAGRRGVGVLGTTIWESLERTGRMIDLYRAAARGRFDSGRNFLTIDEPALKQIAQTTGGSYHRAENADQLQSALDALPGSFTVIHRRVDTAPVFAAGGAILIAAALSLSLWWNRPRNSSR